MTCPAPAARFIHHHGHRLAVYCVGARELLVIQKHGRNISRHQVLEAWGAHQWAPLFHLRGLNGGCRDQLRPFLVVLCTGNIHAQPGGQFFQTGLFHGGQLVRVQVALHHFRSLAVFLGLLSPVLARLSWDPSACFALSWASWRLSLAS